MPAAPRHFRDIVIVGGGCYGTFYARQLLAARDRGRATFRQLIVVDRDPDCAASSAVSDPAVALRAADWARFFDGWLPAAAEGDAIVPSPLMPHLMFDWLLRRAAARWPGREVGRAPLGMALGTPWERAGQDGTSYASYADWTCPVHCIEPATCPVTQAPRTWEMTDAARDLVRRRGRLGRTAGPALFHCRHQVFGVGMFTAAEAQACDALVADAGAPGHAVDVVVGTVSACHGAVGLLRLGIFREP